ncbi:MAG: hypothetical protein ACOX9C_02925 [Kiritimatiellia bacterium]|jgi:hypothetical protein
MHVERKYGKFLRLFAPFCGYEGSSELRRGRGGFAERGMATKNKDAGDAAQVEVFDLKQAQRGIGFEFGTKDASMSQGNSRKHVAILTHTLDD